MHYLFRVAAGTDLDDFGSACREEWRKILLDVARDSETDVFARFRGGSWRDNADYPRIDARAITRKYGSYLAKYASKRTSKGGRNHTFRPGRWCGVSYPLRRLVARRRLDVRLPLSSIQEGVSVAEGLIESISALIQGYRWATLPDWMTTRSISIQISPLLGRSVALALYDFLITGERDTLDGRLSILHARVKEVRINGP
jgi:hypothetical protein